MRWILFIVCVIPLFGFTRLHVNYDNSEKVSQEFRNIENSMQDRQFTVYTSTPVLSQLRDGEIVIFSSGAVKLMLRQGSDLYAVSVSCITIRR